MRAYQTISTRYLAPTNFRGSRIIATTESGIKRTIDQPQNAEIIEAHTLAARELALSLGWSGDWHVGAARNGYVFVCVSPDTLAFRGVAAH